MKASLSLLTDLTLHITIRSHVHFLTVLSLHHTPHFPPHASASAGFPLLGPLCYLPSTGRSLLFAPISASPSYLQDIPYCVFLSVVVTIYYTISSRFSVAAVGTSICYLSRPRQSLCVYYHATHLTFKTLFLAKWMPFKSTKSREVSTKAKKKKSPVTPLRSTEQLNRFSPLYESCSAAICQQQGGLMPMGVETKTKTQFLWNILRKH